MCLLTVTATATSHTEFHQCFRIKFVVFGIKPIIFST